MAGPKAGEERILILAPIGRDAAAIGDVLRRAGLQGVVCPDLPALLDSLRAGAGAAMVAEEALFGRGSTSLVEWVEAQPPWSDLPFIVLTSKQARPEVPVWRKSLLAKLRNASLLERPLDALGLSSAAESAVRSRRRQYEVQAYLSERALAAETLKRLVGERTSELEAANAALRLEMEQRRETEEALRQSQKMEAVGQLTRAGARLQQPPDCHRRQPGDDQGTCGTGEVVRAGALPQRGARGSDAGRRADSPAARVFPEADAGSPADRPEPARGGHGGADPPHGGARHRRRSHRGTRPLGVARGSEPDGKRAPQSLHQCPRRDAGRRPPYHRDGEHDI